MGTFLLFLAMLACWFISTIIMEYIKALIQRKAVEQKTDAIITTLLHKVADIKRGQNNDVTD